MVIIWIGKGPVSDSQGGVTQFKQYCFSKGLSPEKKCILWDFVHYLPPPPLIWTICTTFFLTLENVLNLLRMAVRGMLPPYYLVFELISSAIIWESWFTCFLESKSESETCRFKTSFDSIQKCIFGTDSEGYICNACVDLQLKPSIGTHILKLVWFFNLQVQKRLYLAEIWLIWPLFRGLYSLLLRGECSRNDECSRNAAGM